MKVLIRLDLNVPISNGEITDDSRISNYTQYIQSLCTNNKVCVITHLGRPKGEDPTLSTKKLKKSLEQHWKLEVIFVDSYDNTKIQSTISNLKKGQIILLENTRFFEFEKANDTKVAKQLAQCFDRFIFDAFSCSHRKHLSTNAITKFLPSTLGKTCTNEIINLQKALKLENPLLVMGGAKAQTKLMLIDHFLDKASNILIGGVLANTFLKAQGFNIQESKYEPQLIKYCQSLLQKPTSKKIILPIDFKVSNNLESDSYRTTEILKKNELIADIGPKTTKKYIEIIRQSNGAIFNGPLGYIENSIFQNSSVSIIEEISKLEQSYLGGGDTLKVLNLGQKKHSDFTFVSMAGGAMLEFLAHNGKLEVIENIIKS